eukprot:scaffold6867_cov159-Skeletonema_menzelii.AAC.5
MGGGNVGGHEGMPPKAWLVACLCIERCTSNCSCKSKAAAPIKGIHIKLSNNSSGRHRVMPSARSIPEKSVTNTIDLDSAINWRLLWVSAKSSEVKKAFFVQVISTLMVPHRSHLMGQVGSQASCVAQGIMSNFFYSLSALSNASLAVAYCMIVRCGWRDKDGSAVRLPFTLIPILTSIVAAVAPLFGQNYNYNGGYSCYISTNTLTTCFIPWEQSGAPPGCEFDPNPYKTCERGAQARMMLLITGLLPALIAFFTVTVAVVLLIHAVLEQERRMDRYQRSGRSRKMTMESFYQGVFYIGAFAISWTPWLVFGFREITYVGISMVSYYVMLAATPLHGVLNALVYFRPRLKAERERNPNDSRCKSLMRILHIKCCCNRKSKQGNDDTAIITTNPAEDAEMGNEKENSVDGDPKATTTDSEKAQDAEIGSKNKAIVST